MISSANDITNHFAQVYFPHKALIFYRHALQKEKIYIERFDCSKSGHLRNAHPLSEREIGQLANLFQQQHHEDRYLQSTGLLPDNLLYLNTVKKCAIWYTPCQRRELYFTSSLGLKSGMMPIPALIWKATASDLSLFAMKEKSKPLDTTRLFHAPFYNVHDNGDICMGTVRVNMHRCLNIQEFINTWESYFFNSKFSHIIGNHKHTQTEITTLYRKLLHQPTTFPEKDLVSIKKTLQQILP